MQNNVSDYKDHPSALLRAAYILVGLSWEQSENFEFLQKLARECEEAFQQNMHPTPSNHRDSARSRNRKNKNALPAISG